MLKHNPHRSIVYGVSTAVVALLLLFVIVVALDFCNVFRALGWGGFGALDRAHAELEAGDFDGALHAAERAVRYMDEFTEAYLLRGFAHEALGHYDRALDDYTKVLRLTESSPPIDYGMYMHRGRVYERLGDVDKAIEEYCAAIPQTSDKHLPLICVERKMFPESFWLEEEYDPDKEAELFREALDEMAALIDEAMRRNPEDQNLARCREALNRAPPSPF